MDRHAASLPSITPASAEERGPRDGAEARPPKDLVARWLHLGAASYLMGIAGVAVATGAMLIVRERLDALDVTLIYLLAAFVVALLLGPRSASVAAVASFLAYNFFFLPPYYTFRIDDRSNILLLFVYLSIVAVTGQLVARVRIRTELAEHERERTALLYDLIAGLIGDVQLDTTLGTIVRRVVSVFGAGRSRILLPGADGALAVSASDGFDQRDADQVDRQELAVASWVMDHREPAGLGATGRRLHAPRIAGRPSTAMVRTEDVLYLPIATSARMIGVLEVRSGVGAGRFSDDDKQLLASYAGQAALALERARLAAEASRADALAQSDELKSSLLAAVSHDLRTPLAVIKASATSMLDPAIDWQPDARREFLEAIDEETDRLTLMVENLLDLSRIEAGVLQPDRGWYDLNDLINRVIRRVASRAAQSGHTIVVTIGDEPEIRSFDEVEITQVLTNLVENALKHTPAGTTITVSTQARDGGILVRVHDDGPGIASQQLPHLFETFYRGDGAVRTPGSGIGLAIARGIVEAHDGHIWVESGSGRGTTFGFNLPAVEDTEARV